MLRFSVALLALATFAATANAGSLEMKPWPQVQQTATTPQPPPNAETTGSTSTKVKLIVATWGGGYAQAQELAIFAPYRKETGNDLEVKTHGGDASDLKGKLGSAEWDVVDLGQGALEAACSEGLLESIDAATLTPAKDGIAARDDYLSGGLHNCGVASVAWSAAIAVDRRALKTQPTSIKDLLDVKRFPGKRALPKGPRYTLEIALLADGLEPAQVYRTLETDDGVKRAFAALDKIKGDIAWWERGQEAVAMLGEKNVSMALAFNGRFFNTIVRDNRGFGILWDGQIYDLDFWAVPKQARNKQTALDFIVYATRPERLAAQTRWFPYGPMRKSALKLVGKHAEVDIDMSGFLPTSEANLKTALRLDAAWWAQNEPRLKQRFADWLEGKG